MASVFGLMRGAWGIYAEKDDTGNNDDLSSIQKIDETLMKARGCLSRLFNLLPETEDLIEEAIANIRSHESLISELEQINIEAERLVSLDYFIFDIQGIIDEISDQIPFEIPVVPDNLDQGCIPFGRFIDSFHFPFRYFLPPLQTLKIMCSLATTLRDILDGQGDADAFKMLLRDPRDFYFFGRIAEGDAIQRQLWRLQDLHDGGGFGLTVELFFLAYLQLLSTSSSKESHSALYVGTFRAITSDWSKHKNSLGTQKLLLGIAMSRHEQFDLVYPAYFTDEFLLLLGNIFDGQTGPHIDNARQIFDSLTSYDARGFKQRVLAVLTRGQPQSLAL